MSDAASRAREIAARLASKAIGGGGGDKRKLDEMNRGPINMEVKRKKIFVPQNPEINYLGLLLGPKGSTHRALSESTGAKIFIRGQGSRRDMGSSEAQIGDDEALHVVVEGSLDSIEKATVKINDLLYNTDAALKLKGQQLTDLAADQNNGHRPMPPTMTEAAGALSNEVTVLMEVELPHIGAIIGKGGENISRLTIQSGAKMRIQRIEDMAPDSRTRVITLIGKPANVESLKTGVQAIIDERNMNQGQQQGQQNFGGNFGGGGNPYQQAPPPSQSKRPILENSNIVMKVPVPNDKVGIIIGKGGSQIKAIKEKSGCEVYIPPQGDEDNPDVRTLSIGGDNEDAVKAAYNEISQVLTQYAQLNAGAHSSGPGNTGNKTPTVVMIVPDEKVGSVIGRAGVTIKDLQSRNNVKVVIPSSADPGSMPPMRTLSIYGDPTAANATKIEIERLVSATGQRPHQGQGGHQQRNGNDDKGFGGTTAATYGPGTSGGGGGASSGASATDATMYYADFWVYASHYGQKAARMYYADWSPPAGTPPPPGTIVAPDMSEEQLKAAAAGANSTAGTGGAAAMGQQAQGANQGAEWEKYAAEYKQWWEQHGRAQGAPENPPAM